MKKKIALNLWLFLALVASHQLLAQYDDIYYDPSNDYDRRGNYIGNNDNDWDDDYTYYDDDEFSDHDDEYLDDYDYYYTSRIRRFHRPVRSFGFYDPFYIDMFMYDPFFGPMGFGGSTIYVGFGNSWGWNRWNRFNRWNRWNSWGWNDPWGWNGWGPGWNRWNNWGYNGWGPGWNRWNNWGWNNGWGGCPTNFTQNNYYWYNERNNANQWGSRRMGSNYTSPNPTRRSDRISNRSVNTTPTRGSVINDGGRAPSDRGERQKDISPGDGVKVAPPARDPSDRTRVRKNTGNDSGATPQRGNTTSPNQGSTTSPNRGVTPKTSRDRSRQERLSTPEKRVERRTEPSWGGSNSSDRPSRNRDSYEQRRPRTYDRGSSSRSSRSEMSRGSSRSSRSSSGVSRGSSRSSGSSGVSRGSSSRSSSRSSGSSRSSRGGRR